MYQCSLENKYPDLEMLAMAFLSLKKKKIVSTYLLAVLGLCCCGLFASCSQWGLLSRCDAQASHCNGLSCHRAWAPGPMGFRSCDMRAQ